MSVNLYDSAMVTNVRVLGQCQVMREALEQIIEMSDGSKIAELARTALLTCRHIDKTLELVCERAQGSQGHEQ